MAHTYEKSHKKKEKGRFLQLPSHIIDSEEFASLNGHAVKLLIQVANQYRGYNNGDLCAPWSIMRQHGWKSKDTLGRALKVLLASQFLIITRMGGRNRCQLYAITWQPIHECQGKLDVKPGIHRLGAWKKSPGPDSGAT